MLIRIKYKLIAYILYFKELIKRFMSYKYFKFNDAEDDVEKIINDLKKSKIQEYGEFQISSLEKKILDVNKNKIL
tara:strand:+ start:282 stop:506 length:225 start_codon:yes stop_codon:yes gene_type:complete